MTLTVRRRRPLCPSLPFCGIFQLIRHSFIAVKTEQTIGRYSFETGTIHQCIQLSEVLLITKGCLDRNAVAPLANKAFPVIQQSLLTLQCIVLI